MSVQAAIPPGGTIQRTPITPSVRLCHTGGVPVLTTSDGTNSTPVTTEAYITELKVNSRGVSNGFAPFNGTDVTGNIILGLYDNNGAQVAASAVTAGAGTDAYQRVPWTSPVELQPGTYYVVSMYSSGTARYNTHTVGNFGVSKATGLTTMILPTTIVTPTTFTTALGNLGSLY